MYLIIKLIHINETLLKVSNIFLNINFLFLSMILFLNLKLFLIIQLKKYIKIIFIETL